MTFPEIIMVLAIFLTRYLFQQHSQLAAYAIYLLLMTNLDCFS